jgi:OPA family glycerol-3-phosphate transporter-like MFS transporter
VPKKAVGTAAGLTGLFGYLGGALGANIAIGFIVDHMGWDAAFIMMLIACILAILFTLFTWNTEKKRLQAD